MTITNDQSSSSSDSIQESAKIWIPHPTNIWVKAEVIKSRNKAEDGQVCVKTEDEGGKQLFVRADSILMQNPSLLEGVDDMCSLSYLHEAAVLENIRFRLSLNQIYTYTGSLLIALNPYTTLPLYGKEMIEVFCGQSENKVPHVYAIAERSYREMLNYNTNQSILVSGESGAGKTETTKFLLSYFAAMAEKSKFSNGEAPQLPDREKKKPQEEGNPHQSIEEKVLKSTPVLEAFGNAKTLRNDNSSRFGKFIEIQFDQQKGIILGARIRHYLLEKSRIVRPPLNERNYHIFYQLIAGIGEQERTALSLFSDPSNFHYLKQSNQYIVEEVDEKNMFQVTSNALSVVGLTNDELRCVWNVLAAVLHLGNVTFYQENSNEEASSKINEVYEDFPSEYNPLVTVSNLLGIDLELLKKTLVIRKIKAGRESYELKMTTQQSAEARDSLSMLLYSRLFDWLVFRINQSIYHPSNENSGSSKVHLATISLLDIYGFEFFENNSFEQFTINYANEVLQNQFNQHIFKLEQQEYIKEKIDWSYVEFNDNQECVDLIESKSMGVLALLDEECTFPKASPLTLASKLISAHSKNKYFEKPRFSQNHFTIKHYAGDVIYDTSLFLDKNKDYILPDQVTLVEQSKNEFVKNLFKVSNQGDKTKSGSFKFTSVASQFRESLGSLMTTIKGTNPHYIRCCKPNSMKKPLTFDPKMVLHQLKCGGVMEQLRISRAGYPGRMHYSNFFKRYKLLAANEISMALGKNVLSSPKRGNTNLNNSSGSAPLSPQSTKSAKRGCEILINTLGIEKDKVQFGETKIFLRAGVIAGLEQERSSTLNKAAISLQKIWKGYYAKILYKKIQVSTQVLQNAIRNGMARAVLHSLREENSTLKIQTYIRMTSERNKLLSMYMAASVFQRCIRVFTSRQQLLSLREKHATIVLQKNIRCQQARSKFAIYKHSVVRLQTRWRGKSARKLLKEMKVEARKLTNVVAEKSKLEEKCQVLQYKLTAETRLSQKLELDLKKAQEELQTTQEKCMKLEVENKELRKQHPLKPAQGEKIQQSEKKIVEQDKDKDKERETKVNFELEKKKLEEVQKNNENVKEENEKLMQQIKNLQGELDALKAAQDKNSLQNSYSENNSYTPPKEIPKSPTLDATFSPQRIFYIAQNFSPRSIVNSPLSLRSPSSPSKPSLVPEMPLLNETSSPKTLIKKSDDKENKPTDLNATSNNISTLKMQKVMAENKKMHENLHKEKQIVQGLKSSITTLEGTIQAQDVMMSQLSARIRFLEGSKSTPKKEKGSSNQTPSKLTDTGFPQLQLPGVSDTEPTPSIELMEYIDRSTSPLEVSKSVVSILVDKSTQLPSVANKDSNAKTNSAERNLFIGGVPEAALIIFKYLFKADQTLNQTDPKIGDFVIETIGSVIDEHSSNDNVLCFWLSNISMLYNLCLSECGHESDKISGTKKEEGNECGGCCGFIDFKNDSKTKGVPTTPTGYSHNPSPNTSPLLEHTHHHASTRVNKNVVQFKKMIKRLFIKIYLAFLWKSITKLNKLLHATLFDESMSSESMDPIVSLLNEILLLFQSNLLYIPISCHFFEQVFYYMNAVMFNEVLLRKDLNSSNWGLNMKMKLAEIDNWVKNVGKEWVGQAINQLKHISQCISVMIVDKKGLATKEMRTEVCPDLTLAQIKQLLSMYCIDADSFEPQIPVTVLNAIMKSPEYRSDLPLLLDTSKITPMSLKSGVHYIQSKDVFQIRHNSEWVVNEIVSKEKSDKDQDNKEKKLPTSRSFTRWFNS